MLYVLRFGKGDCAVVSACDEQSARELAHQLGMEDHDTPVSVRELGSFAVRFSPNEEGSLEIRCWNDSTLDDILVHEYPILRDAFRAANAVSFMPAAEAGQAFAAELKRAYEQNVGIIRKGLLQEKHRFDSDPVLKSRKAAQQ